MQIVIVDVNALARSWWLFALRGVAGVLFGVVTLLRPDISLAALVLLFGAYALVDGVFALLSAGRRMRTRERWGTLALQGLVGIAVGIVTLLWPGITALALLYTIAIWAIVTGAIEIAVAIRLRREIAGEWLLVASGLLSVILGVLMMLFPGGGVLALIALIGAYALVTGALLIVLGFRLRALAKAGQPHPGDRRHTTTAPEAQPTQRYS